MKNTIFTGAATAIITPTNEQGVDFEKFGRLIDWQIEEGIDSLVICGTTGEGSTLSDEEHRDALEFAYKRAAGRVPMIAGTGSNDTDYAIDLTKYACEIGCDAMLVVTPYYNKATQKGLIQSFTAIADASTKPIILYNVPSRTGVAIKPETYKELSKHEKIVAVKEANGDLSSVAKTRYLCGDDLDIYSGNDDQIIPIMSLGGIGVISVLSNILPAETHQMCKAALQGDFDLASKLQIKYTGLINALFSDVNPIPVKEAMNLMGMEAGPCRLPLYPMNDNVKSVLIQKLKECNCL